MNSHTLLLLNGCMRCRMPAGQLGRSWCILLRPAVICGSRPVKASTSFFQRAARPWAISPAGSSPSAASTSPKRSDHSLDQRS